MTPNDQLMEQCRREAEETYVHPEYNEARFITTADTMIAISIIDARREAYAAALFHERSKPRGLTVEEAKRVVQDWATHHRLKIGHGKTPRRVVWNALDDLEVRITAKLNSNG